MLKKFVNYILVPLVLISCFYGKAAAQDIQARAKLDMSTIRIGDQAKLHLSVEQPSKEQVSFPKLADTLTGKVQVISSGKQDTIRDQNNPDRITVTKSIIITSFDAGDYTIPAFVFSTKTGDVKTNEIELSVQSVKVDTTKAIYDIKQPLAVSYSFMDWLKDNWHWIVLGVVIILSIAGIIWYLQKRKNNKPAIIIPEPVIPVHTIALNKLKALRDKKLWQQNEVKQHYIELSDVIREYLEKRYQIKTQEKTTDEIFEGLENVEITAENKQMLHHLLMTADLVKFAKEQPLPLENEQHIETAIDFVHKTYHTEKAVNAEQSANVVKSVNAENSVGTEKSANIEGGNTGEHA